MAKRVFAIIALVLSMAGCRVPGEDTQRDAELPNWLVRVYPAPDSEMGSVRRVEVRHDVQTGGDSVRLIIDGIDVTAEADFGREQTVGGPGRLVYDSQRGNFLVELNPGVHTARVERVRLTELGGESEVLDSYSWEFTIQ